jgi:hypothetical protein
VWNVPTVICFAIARCYITSWIYSCLHARVLLQDSEADDYVARNTPQLDAVRTTMLTCRRYCITLVSEGVHSRLVIVLLFFLAASILCHAPENRCVKPLDWKER